MGDQIRLSLFCNSMPPKNYKIRQNPQFPDFETELIERIVTQLFLIWMANLAFEKPQDESELKERNAVIHTAIDEIMFVLQELQEGGSRPSKSYIIRENPQYPTLGRELDDRVMNPLNVILVLVEEEDAGRVERKEIAGHVRRVVAVLREVQGREGSNFKL